MTVPSASARNDYLGTGTTGPFPFTFGIQAASHLVVVKRLIATGVETPLVQGVDYTLAGSFWPAGGSFTLAATLANTYALTARRIVPITQQVDLRNQGAYFPDVSENVFDLLTEADQQQQDQIDRSIKVPATEAGSSLILPAALQRALQVLGFDAIGNVIAAQPSSALVSAALAVVVAAASIGAGRVAFGDVAGSVNTIAALKALATTDLTGGQVVRGYYAYGDGGGGTYFWNAADTRADNGGTIIQPNSGGVGRWNLLLVDGHVNVLQFGAKGDNATDDGPAFQAAISSLANGGFVKVAQRNYAIGTALVANTGVLLDADVRTDLSTNTNGSGGSASKPSIRWIGTVGGRMYTVRPATVGNNVWGGGSRGISWDGADSAAGAVVLDNTKAGYFSGSVRAVTADGVWISSLSGSPTCFSQQNRVDALEFVYGAAVADQFANGLRITGNGVNVPGTQQFIGRLTGLVYHGAMLRIEETDNCQVEFAGCSVLGSGCTVYLRNTGFGQAGSNVFVQVFGPVFFDNALTGNTFLNYNSEGGGFNQLAGTSDWSGELMDYVTCRRYKSHVYQLRKKISVSPGMMKGDAACGVADLAGQWQTLTFPKAGSPRAAVFIPPDYDLSNGYIEGIEVYYADNSGGGGSWFSTVTCSCITNGVAGPVVTPGFSSSQAMPVAAANTPSVATVTFGTPLAFANGQWIAVAIQRLSANAGDTCADAICITGIRILYRSKGPDSGGGGTYNSIPSWV